MIAGGAPGVTPDPPEESLLAETLPGEYHRRARRTGTIREGGRVYRRREATMKTDTGLGDKDRAGLVKMLSALLADEVLLYTKTRNYHWNVRGPHFNDLHKLFDAQYAELNGIVDEVAERIRALGFRSPGTLSEFQKLSRLKEKPGDSPDAPGMLKSLLGDHEAVCRSLRTDIEAAEGHHDPATADFLTGLLEQHEKTAWMLRASLE
jgi:starvation-inducible DNA-binding protein